MRLIDADKLKNDICFLKHVNGIPATVNYNRPLIDKAQACECIDKQPTIEVPQWIPVEESLPKNSGYYLVTQSMHSLKDFNKILRSDVECVEFCHGEWKRANHLEVIAWMPLPQAYTGKEE